MNLAELAGRKIREFGEYVTLIFEDNEYTNVQMHEQSKRFAGGLKRLGIKPDDKVMVLMPNCPEVLISYPAIWRLGAIIVPVLFLLEAHEVSYIAADSEAAAIITSPEFLYKVQEARRNAPSLRHVIIVGDEQHPDTILFNRLVEEPEPVNSIYPTKDDDVAALLYTSGTTGRPKGVMLAHKNLHAQAINTKNTAGDADRGDVSLVVLPLSHSYGLGLLVSGYVSDRTGRAVLLRWFNLEEVFRAIEKYKVANMAGVPTMFIYMLHYPEADKYDTTSVQTWLVGAAPMPLEKLREFEQKFGGVMHVAYGLTEAAPGVAAQRDSDPRKPGSVGTAMAGVEVKIFDENDGELPPNSVGEIVCRGDNIMLGYYKMPEDTEKTLRGGWLHTGDMGYLDEDGHLFIVERKKDLIIRGGFNIYPKDVEDVLYLHPAVAEAAVVGKADETMGEEVMAYVTLKPGAVAKAEELIAHCQSRLAKYKCPRRVEFLDAMPKTPIGKIQKKELRKLAAQQG
ncbi:MAG: long-chain-fatty-acid--CoA ligase [Candidatus Abyssobacteria bacterium SURF_17]|uniref:Long-chain-fatty-acid--CoA ligase n=1 Tax=Candidatus Abyssobacteria bacterium SURF_17 TaxID=2093361 RepID=A0A419EYG8_9BACT|nr:MAG: long-chain-fatty-acid--CoA ligase [Candidatus Abyssubacteria bacterium SURF_17]